MKHIFVIDDEPEILRMFTSLLEARYRVSSAHDGKVALERFRADPADLAIVDIFMPGIDGLVVIDELQEIAPEVKIIAISGGGYGGAVDLLSDAEALGACRSFSKPVDIGAFMAAIEQELGE